MPAIYVCPLCGKKIINALTCNGCRRKYDLTEPWAQQLLRDEMDARNRDLKDQRHSLETFTEHRFTLRGEEYDGWDAIDGAVSPSEEKSVARKGGISTDDSEYYTVESWEELIWDRKRSLRKLAVEAKLTKGEYNALKVHVECHEPDDPIIWQLRSEVAALKLAELEGKPVSAEAYRRRISDLRRRLRSVVDAVLFPV